MRNLKRFLTSSFMSVVLLLPLTENKVMAQTAKQASKVEKQITKKAKISFVTWLKSIRQQAVAHGISQKTIDAALPYTLQPLNRVVELDRKQPEVTRTFDEYVDAIVSKKRVDTGMNRIDAYRPLLEKVSNSYDGVPAEVIVALWGVETNYGKNMGDFSLVQALATLAYDGRRSEFFKTELFNALKIVDKGYIDLPSLKGSWAGAMGQNQFMPSSYLSYAQDYDGDGHRDIWKTPADVFASTANYLRKNGWKKGETWGQRIELPNGFNRKLIGLDQSHTVRSLIEKGIKIEGISDLSMRGSVIQPGGVGTSAYVVFDNYKVIMKWNKSNAFATSVGLISDKLKR